MEVFTFAPVGQRSSDGWGSPEGDAESETEPAHAFTHWSNVFAAAMQRQLLVALHADDRGKKIKHLGVLRSLHCPGILAEPAFLSNDAEAQKLATPAFRQQVAEALADGVRAYAHILERLRQRQSSDLPH